MAAGEILAYNIFDPINLLGFGAGKIVASTAGRVALKGVINKALSTAAKRPVLAGAVSGAAVDRPAWCSCRSIDPEGRERSRRTRRLQPEKN
jgi:hypothetical protein